MVENMCIFLFPFCPMTLIVRGIAFHLAFFFERFLCHCFGICNCIYQIFNYRVSHIPGVNTFVVAASAQKYFNNKIIHICWEIRKIISSPPAQTCVNEGELLLTPVLSCQHSCIFQFSTRFKKLRTSGAVFLRGRITTKGKLCGQDQPHALHLPGMDRAALHSIDAGGIDRRMPQNVRQP